MNRRPNETSVFDRFPPNWVIAAGRAVFNNPPPGRCPIDALYGLLLLWEAHPYLPEVPPAYGKIAEAPPAPVLGTIDEVAPLPTPTPDNPPFRYARLTPIKGVLDTISKDLLERL